MKCSGFKFQICPYCALRNVAMSDNFFYLKKYCSRIIENGTSLPPVRDVPKIYKFKKSECYMS